MSTRIPGWRSLLFVPADKPRLIEGAHKRGADALILDLEDAVPLADKPLARETLLASVTQLRAQGLEVIVRVNAEPEQLYQDLLACRRAEVSTLMLPKVESPQSLAAFETQRATVAQEADFTPALIALIESPAALLRASEIAAAPQVAALALGSEDFALSLGVAPSAACLSLPCQWLALAAAGHGKRAYGLAHSLADFSDLQALAAAAGQARATGLHGALCIHPSQVAVINRAFAPCDAELDWARQVVSAWDAAAGGVARLGESMIDRPVIERARHLLKQGARS
ncbi:citrate lyase subunit beta / citryl-CoA lyase [Pseudomonas flavescens]|uniref:Citrate lyase subunit beta / citryl-CoA lyase n=1 Tax=Phytopseudomonas flavescens TaxID=29435 RepID=A0A1G7Y3Q9_9GAMM|nr:CoA ester lyase [Pseudomonas flavescens]SDG91075.1 citrate lyase subunit beta / citryl-CoA lyase [Pseudomonas flavescens]